MALGVYERVFRSVTVINSEEKKIMQFMELFALLETKINFKHIYVKKSLKDPTK